DEILLPSRITHVSTSLGGSQKQPQRLIRAMRTPLERARRDAGDARSRRRSDVRLRRASARPAAFGLPHHLLPPPSILTVPPPFILPRGCGEVTGHTVCRERAALPL